MTRRQKTSPLEDWINLLAKLPWWLCLALAAAAYLVLHPLAAPVQTTNVQSPGAAMGIMQKAVIQGLSSVGQYLIPLLCVLAAVLSVVRRKKRQCLVNDVAQARSADALNGMSWREFELLVGEAYRLQGFRITENGGGGADGGVDLVLAKGGEKFFVQCKQWKAYKVGVDVVRQLYGVMAAKGATGGFVVTSGRFTNDAEEFAQGRNIELIDGPKLFAMIRSARQTLRTMPAAPPMAQAVQSAPATSASTTAAPAFALPAECPQCGAAMKLRTARQGTHAGRQFWGCVSFPNCRGTRPVP